MSQVLSELEKRALGLPAQARAELAKQLLLSLEEASSEEHEQVWAEEAESRLREIQDGRTQTIPAERVLEEARARLR